MAGQTSLRALVARELGVTEAIAGFLETAAADDLTVPFVARYRRHLTGGMTETRVEEALALVADIKAANAAREKMCSDLRGRNMLSPELEARLREAVTSAQLEAIYQPFKVTRKTNASKAREQGLEPLASALLTTAEPAPKEFHKLSENDQKLLRALVVEKMFLTSEALAFIDEQFPKTASLSVAFASKGRKAAIKELSKEEFEKKQRHYRTYDGRRFRPDRIEAHQTLAVLRGESQGFLKVEIHADHRTIKRGVMAALSKAFPSLQQRLAQSTREARFVQSCFTDAYDDHFVARAERALRSELKERAETESIALFRRNLRRMLSQRPLQGQPLLAVDPGFGNGCKWAALKADGNVEQTGRFFLPKKGDSKGSKGLDGALKSRMLKSKIRHVVVGDGTASYEAEGFVASACQNDPDLAALDVTCCRGSEHGASVYSASKVAQEELGEMDLLFRSAVSIGRRVLDPLSELVKIPVQSLGVGLYQHDIAERKLLKGLTDATVSTVARVGVNVNTASKHVLLRVPGMTERAVAGIVEGRSPAGGIRTRADLTKLSGVTKQRFEAIAGFVRVPGSSEPLDDTNVHPESYGHARKILRHANVDLARESWDAVHTKLRAKYPVRPVVELGQRFDFSATSSKNDGHALVPVAPTYVGDDEVPAVQVDRARAAAIATELGIEPERLAQILEALCSPRADTRERLPYAGLFHEANRSMTKTRAGDRMYSRVENVVAFGAWLDVGMEKSGFAHSSELVDEHGAAIKASPTDLLGPCDVVLCTFLGLDDKGPRLRIILPRSAVGAPPSAPNKAVPPSSSSSAAAAAAAQPDVSGDRPVRRGHMSEAARGQHQSSRR